MLDQDCTEKDIDTAFVETNVEVEVMEDNPPTELQRYEFLEIILRIAGQKYVQSGTVDTYKDAL